MKRLIATITALAALAIGGFTAQEVVTNSAPAAEAAGCGRWVNNNKGYSYCNGQTGSQRARLECRHIVSPTIKTWRYGPWKSRMWGSLSITSPCPSGYQAWRVYTEYSSQY